MKSDLPYNVMRHRDWEVAPRDPVTIGTLILGQVGAAAAGTFITAAVGYLATTVITSWALQALAPKPKSGGAQTQGLLTNLREAAAPREYVYGEVRKGGVITYLEATGTNNKFLHMIISLAGHELQSIDDIYINDEIVALDGNGLVTSAPWNSKIRVQKFLGNQITAPASLLAESAQVNGNFIGRGIAYLYIRMEYDQDVFANGIPLFTAKVKGKKVFDPRTSTTAYSANAALCIRDYLVTDYGMADVGATDDTVFSVAANVCDEVVTLDGGGTEKRYEMNGVISAALAPGDILQSMMTSCAGTLFWGQGKWQLKPGYYTSPAKTFTLDDLRGPISLSTRTSRRDNFNIVRGKFNSADARWITADYPELRSATFIAEDGGLENALDIEFPLTTSDAMVQRLAKLTLFRAREQMAFSADFSMAAFDVQVGDIIALTNSRYGWVDKDFEVVGWRFFADGDAGDLRVNLTLRETSAAAFAWDAEELDIISNNTNLPVFNAGLDIFGLTASGGGRTQGDGTFINSAILSWTTAANAFVSHYDVEWKPTADSSFASTATPENTIELSPLIDGIEYTFRVRSVTVSGARGPYATVTLTGGGDVTAPGLPTAVTATGGFGYITVKWTNPTDADLNYVEVWENTTNSSSTATFLAASAGSQFIRSNLDPSTSRWFFLRSVDFSGNKSAFTDGVQGTSTFVDDQDFADGIYSLFTDQGLYAIRDVTSLPPSGAFVGEKVFNRTDGKLYQWTGSVWQLVVADVADGAITETKIADDAITTPKIFAGAITANEIAGNTITGDKIVANTITGGLLATSGIITNTAQIDDLIVDTAKIKNLAVERIKIGDNAVSERITDTIVNLSVASNIDTSTPTVVLDGTFAAVGGLTNLTRVSILVSPSQSQLQANGVASRFGVLVRVFIDSTLVGRGISFLLRSDTSGVAFPMPFNELTLFQRIGSDTVSLVCPWISSVSATYSIEVRVNCGYFTSTGAFGSQTIAAQFSGALETEFLAK
jgi:hypothetical protein